MLGHGGSDSISGGDGGDSLFGGHEADTIDGGAGNDHLDGGGDADLVMGGAGADTLNGGTGNDTLQGGEGADVYVIGHDSGQPTIVNEDRSDSPAQDTLSFGEDVSATDLWFSESGDDLMITELGTSNEVTVQDWFRNQDRDAVRHMAFSAGDATMQTQEVLSLIQAMAAFEVFNPGFDPNAHTLDGSNSNQAIVTAAIDTHWRSS